MPIAPFNREFFGQPLSHQKVDEANLYTVQNLHRMILPLTFSSTFFKSLLELDSLSFLLNLAEKPIGFICFKAKCDSAIYLQSFGILPVYRGSGIGSFVFDFMIKIIKSDPIFKQIELHVQEGNVKAVKFYQSLGFKTANRLPKYYKRLDDPTALHLVLDL